MNPNTDQLEIREGNQASGSYHGYTISTTTTTLTWFLSWNLSPSHTSILPFSSSFSSTSARDTCLEARCVLEADRWANRPSRYCARVERCCFSSCRRDYRGGGGGGEAEERSAAAAAAALREEQQQQQKRNSEVAPCWPPQPEGLAALDQDHRKMEHNLLLSQQEVRRVMEELRREYEAQRITLEDRAQQEVRRVVEELRREYEAQRITLEDRA
ncbi:hypothetical protein CRUP_020159 [Coryphaenoides rupestris]|nr:hypothetical protein CRUP_020159 [Coryphaenoides rupestris]